MGKSKKFFGVLMVAASVLALLPGCSRLKDNRINSGYNKGKDMSGKCGENLTYEYVAKTGKLTIKGTGEMTSCPWSGYGGVSVRSVEFEEGITSIYNGAFYSQSELEGDIVLPSTVTFIDEFAFYGTKSVSSVKIPDGVTHLGDYAFRGSGIAGELYLPDSITYIGVECFGSCSNISGTLKLPSSLETIGRVAFSKCEGLTGDLVIPDSVKTIGDYAFANCSGLNGRLVLSQNLEAIEANCFDCDENLKGDLVIPEKVRVIGENAFRGCGFDGKLILPEDMADIGSQAFQNCKSLKGDVVIPNGIKMINSEVFWGCEGLESVVFPKGLKYICSSSFEHCISLSGKLTLPDSLVAIGKGAFKDCEKLSGKLEIPDTVTLIDDRAFYGCSGFSGELKISQGLLAVGKESFKNCSGIEGELLIPDSVAVVGASAFEGCKSIAKVTIGKGVTSIGKKSFAGCESLTQAKFNNTEWIPDYYGMSYGSGVAGIDDASGNASDGAAEGNAVSEVDSNSFDNSCSLSIPSSAKNINVIWGSGHTAVNNETGENTKPDKKGNDDEVPYFWTEGLRANEFSGVGSNSDTTINFDDSIFEISINGREPQEYKYSADANSDDNTIIIDKVWFKDGYIENLEFLYGRGVNVVKGDFVKGNGQKEEIYFVANGYSGDREVNLMITLENGELSKPF